MARAPIGRTQRPLKHRSNCTSGALLAVLETTALALLESTVGVVAGEESMVIAGAAKEAMLSLA